MKSWRIINWKLFVPVLVTFFAGLLIGHSWPRSDIGTDIYGVRENSQGRYKFINPLLYLESRESSISKDLEPLKKEVQEFVNSKIRNGDVADISVYFRQSASRWFGINIDDKYNPASLLKIPTMIAAFRIADDDSGFLSKTVVYDGSFNDNAAEYYQPTAVLRKGPYTMDELISAMIVNSDNNATRLLHDNIAPSLLNETYKDLGLSVPSSNKIDFMTVRDYSYFFRVLYNATYLSRELSEKALALLSVVDFQGGIRAALPKGTKIAQKFGERTIVYPGYEEKQLHDCGLVYAGKNSQPYFICIMTRGRDFELLNSAIQSIALTTYNWVQANQ